jgi:uncharacterized protein YecE (DUF72 family)
MKSAAVFIGTSGWTYDHWKGNFYPEQPPKNQWFNHYCRFFKTIEVNATFYRQFRSQTYENWYKQSPPEFRFTLKIPQIITHRKFLIDVGEDIRQFEDSALQLNEKLGLMLLQLAPQTPYDPNLLAKTLSLFQQPDKVAVEFRDKKWFTEEIFALLKKFNSITCNIDSPQIQVLDLLTSHTAYFRMHGRNKWYNYDYSQNELENFRAKIADVVIKGAEKIFVFFNNDFNGFAPDNALKLTKILHKFAV